MLVLKALVVGPMDLATASMAFKWVLLEEHARVNMLLLIYIFGVWRDVSISGVTGVQAPVEMTLGRAKVFTPSTGGTNS